MSFTNAPFIMSPILTSQISPHGRWRHLDADIERIQPMLQKWSTLPGSPDTKEQARRIVDLFFVSVLLDAGAGNAWKYKESTTGLTFSRSEGLAVASFHMFESGLFSSHPDQPYRVDGRKLQSLE